MKENVVLFDSSLKEAEDFINGLESCTEEKWIPIVCNSNKGRSFLNNVIRYLKYFIFPFFIFLNRNKYNTIIGWQEFYGLVFAFYCRLFGVKKQNKLIIKNFIYKPKNGYAGKLYFNFMKYIVKSGYIDCYICASNSMINYCCEVFDESREKFFFMPFGVPDFTKEVNITVPPSCDYVLSLGRSNRDWNFLLDCFTIIDVPLIIICDELYRTNIPPNVMILNDIYGNESYEYIYNCKCMIISIDNAKIASGDTVLLQAMSFSKPIIITKPSCLADDYVIDGVNGIIVNKNIQEMREAIRQIYEDNELCNRLANNSRQIYLDKHSLFTYGCNVGKLVLQISKEY